MKTITKAEKNKPMSKEQYDKSICVKCKNLKATKGFDIEGEFVGLCKPCSEQVIVIYLIKFFSRKLKLS